MVGETRVRGLYSRMQPQNFCGTQGVYGGWAVCMEATVRVPLRCCAGFELQPPWGDPTNHGGGWVVWETHREGFILTECRKWHATCGTESDELSSCELGINSRSDARS